MFSETFKHTYNYQEKKTHCKFFPREVFIGRFQDLALN